MAQMDMAHQADRFQALQVAIDGGRDRRQGLAGELLRGLRSVGGKESFEEKAPRG